MFSASKQHEGVEMDVNRELVNDFDHLNFFALYATAYKILQRSSIQIFTWMCTAFTVAEVDACSLKKCHCSLQRFILE